MTKREKLLTVMIVVLVGFIGLTYFTRTETNISEFNCDGMGLRVSSDSVVYGPTQWKICEKSGVEIYAGTTCGVKGERLTFDEVSHTLIAPFVGVVQCSKVK